MKITKTSPCKVNFILNILGKRPDGFHDLETLMVPVPVHDTLEFERGGRDVRLSCNIPELPADQTNLVHRAATAFLAAAKIQEGVSIRLEKHIPLAAGLGGGSGNAAITLTGLNELFGGPLDGASLTQLAASLGSDVPFFLQQHPAIGTGRGEQIHPVGALRALENIWILLIHPGFGVPTAWAYKQLANYPQSLSGKPGRVQKMVQLLQSGSLADAKSEFYNSLEAPVLNKYPVLLLYQEFLRAHGSLAALMSGSGSTTFALLPSEAAARQMEAAFVKEFVPQWTRVVPLGPITG